MDLLLEKRINGKRMIFRIKLIASKKSAFVAVCLSSLWLIGCSSGSNDVVGDTGATIKLSSLPIDTRSINPEALTLTVLIDGVNRSVAPNGAATLWTGNFKLPTDRAVDLSITWEYQGFLLARYIGSVGPIGDSTTLSITQDDYTTTGEEFDPDNDGLSNLAELRNSTNSTDPDNIDVRIPAVTQANRPGINGVTGLVWADNIINDWEGQPLSVSNLMIDLGATRDNEATEFYWQAVHDGTSLFIIVYGEAILTETPFGDSVIASRDDAINLFIDGDNSKLESYDGTNDFHFIIPLLARTQAEDSLLNSSLVTDANGDLVINDAGELKVQDSSGERFVLAAAPTNNDNQLPGGRIGYGNASAGPITNIRFATGRPLEGQHVYEVRIGLAALGIEVGKPFGIDVQLDNDDDGGNKDARYAWKHPAKDVNGADVNNTIANPSFMGTAILQ